MQAGRAWMRGLCSGDKIGTMSTCDFFPQLLARPQRVPAQPRGEDLGKEVPGTLWRFLLSSHQVEEQPRAKDRIENILIQARTVRKTQT